MRFERKRFFNGFRDRIDSTIEQEQVDGLEFLLTGFEQDMRWGDVRHVAYALATVFHETAGSFQPVEEGYYLGPTKAKRHQKTLRYYPFFGRGYVQLTWRENYDKAGKVLGLDLVKHPEQAVDPTHAFRILTEGLFRGWFGGKLTTYINDKKTDYVNARRCVNILDKAGLIAGYAKHFEKILNAAAAPAGTTAKDGPAKLSGQENLQAGATDPGAKPQTMPPPSTEPPPVSVQTVTTEISEVPKTGIKATIAAGIAFVTGAGSGVFSLFQGLAPIITLGFFGAAALVAIAYIGFRHRANENAAQRKAEADEKDKQRSHELQVLIAEAARNKGMNTIELVPPAAVTGAIETPEKVPAE